MFVDASATPVGMVLLATLSVPDASTPFGRSTGQVAPVFEIPTLWAFPLDQATLAFAAGANADSGG